MLPQVLIYGAEAPPPQPYQNAYENHNPIPEPTHANNIEKPVEPVSHRESVDEYHENHNNGDYKGGGHFDEEEDTAFQGNDEKDECDNSSKSGRSSAVHVGQRTVLLRGLPDRVTHHDITEAVRGGALLDIFLRAREHMASVSFVEESAAQEFLHYARQYGVYVAGKRVSVYSPT